MERKKCISDHFGVYIIYGLNATNFENLPSFQIQRKINGKNCVKLICIRCGYKKTIKITTKV